MQAGKTSLDHAQGQGHKEIVNILKHAKPPPLEVSDHSILKRLKPLKERRSFAEKSVFSIRLFTDKSVFFTVRILWEKASFTLLISLRVR